MKVNSIMDDFNDEFNFLLSDSELNNLLKCFAPPLLLENKVKKVGFVALDAPDFNKPNINHGSETSKSFYLCPKINLFNFSAYEFSDEKSMCDISSFLIDLFDQSKNVLYLYSLCQHVLHVKWDDFVNAVQCDYDVVHVTIVDISTPEQLHQAYIKHLPGLGCRSAVKNRDEVCKFMCLSLMCLAKSSEFKQFDIFLKNQVKNLEGGQVSQLLQSLDKNIAVEIARQLDDLKCNVTRVLLVKWILDNRSKMQKPLSTYLEKVCKVWKGSRMTHIILIKDYIWDKTGDKLIKWKMESRKSKLDFEKLDDEIEAFETVVVPHFSYEYFDYIRLVQSKNVFAGASARYLPTLINAAVKFAIPSNPRLKNYSVPRNYNPTALKTIESIVLSSM